MTQFTPTPTEEEVPAEDTTQADNVLSPQGETPRRAILVAQNIALNAFLFAALGVYLTITTGGAWQAIQFIILSTQVIVTGFVSAALIRRGRGKLGAWLLFASDLIAPIWASLLVSDLGYVAVAYILVTTYFIISYMIPRGARRLAVVLTVFGLAISTLAEVIDPAWRLVSALMLTVAPILTALLGAVFIAVIARQAWAGSMRNKMLVAFIGVTVVATGVLGAFMFTTTSNNLQDNLERELSEVAVDRARRIGDLFNEQINTLTAISLNEALQGAVETQNNSYEGSTATIQATLDAKDAQWRRADEADNNNDFLVRENLTNDVAKELIEYQQTFPANVEVFITDVYGGLAGTTNRTSDYFQADEGWWQAAYNDGQGAVYIADPEFDESAGAIGVNIALPLRDQDTGEITGILRTTYIVSPLASILAEKVGQTGEADLYFPGEVISHIHEGEFGPAEVEEFEALQAVADQGMAEMEYEDTPSVVSQAQVQTFEGNPAVDNLGWVVVLHQQRDEAFAPVDAAIQGFIIVLLIVVALAAAAAYGFSLFLVRPIARLTTTAEEVSAGNLDSRAEVTTSDEVGTLATTFNTMTSQLQETLGGLEQRVADRTKALATSAEVTRRLATVLDPRQLASDVVNEVRDSFEYYYAQIYLLDETGENLVISGGTGQAGASMVASGHSVQKGRGLVGRAADANASVLVSDVSQEEGWLPNELLPETRAETAIPISVGNQVLGVLDVQHNIVGGLTAEDVTLLESLAGQVAITLQNARSYEQSRSQAELESLVNVIGQKIQRATTMEDTLQTAIRELGTAIGASRVKASLQPASTTVPTEPIAPAEPLVAVVEGEEGTFDTETTPAD